MEFGSSPKAPCYVCGVDPSKPKVLDNTMTMKRYDGKTLHICVDCYKSIEIGLKIYKEKK